MSKPVTQEGRHNGFGGAAALQWLALCRLYHTLKSDMRNSPSIKAAENEALLYKPSLHGPKLTTLLPLTLA
jgi:hypothetical protein